MFTRSITPRCTEVNNTVVFASKWSNDRFGWKIRPNLGKIFSRSKCNREKPICFLQKTGVNKIKLGIKRQWDRNRGYILGKFPTTFKYGSAPYHYPGCMWLTTLCVTDGIMCQCGKSQAHVSTDCPSDCPVTQPINTQVVYGWRYYVSLMVYWVSVICTWIHCPSDCQPVISTNVQWLPVTWSGMQY